MLKSNLVLDIAAADADESSSSSAQLFDNGICKLFLSIISIAKVLCAGVLDRESYLLGIFRASCYEQDLSFRILLGYEVADEHTCSSKTEDDGSIEDLLFSNLSGRCLIALMCSHSTPEVVGAAHVFHAL